MKFKSKSVCFSDVYNCTFCVQIKPESYEWFFLVRSVEQWCMCEPQPKWKLAIAQVCLLCSDLNVLFLVVNLTNIRASEILLACCGFYITIL